MVIYGLILSVLVDYIRGEYPVFLQSWYADDFITSGAHIKPAIACIDSLSLACGFFLGPEKSRFVISPGVSEEAAMADTAPLECSHREGESQLDGCMLS